MNNFPILVTLILVHYKYHQLQLYIFLTLKYSDIISEGVTKPYLFDNIHCLLENRMLIKGIETAARAVTANGRPLTKIKPGCKKNIQPEKAVQVIIVINDQPGTCLPNMKKSTGVIIFF